MRFGFVVALLLAALALAVPAAVGQSEGAVLSVTVVGKGQVTSNDDNVDCPGQCTATYFEGETVTLTAHPDSGSTFAGWSKDCTGTGSCVVEMDSSHDVKAKFRPSCDGDCDGNELTVEVKGNGHVRAAGGGGGGGGGGGPAPPLDIEIAMDTTGSMGASIEQAQADAKTLVADVEATFPGTLFAVVQFKDFFDTPEYELLQPMTSDGNLIDAAIDTLSPGGGGDAPEAYNLVFQNSVSDGTTGWRSGSRKLVVVIGDAAPHGAGTAGFAGCSDTSEDPHGLNTATVLASMKANERTLIMVRQAATASTTLECYQSLAAATFEGGAAQDGGSDLISVIEDLIGGAVKPPPGGNGGGINCPKDCSEVYFHEEEVVLRAEASSGWVFDSWGGACSGGGTCTVQMTKDRNVTATFRRRSSTTTPAPGPQQEPQTFGLTVGIVGTGSVGSSPGGISCGGGCASSFPVHTVVRLVPVPGVGWRFAFWGGDCGGSGGCTVTLDGPRRVTATFTQRAPLDEIGPPTNPINDSGVVGDNSLLTFAFECFAPEEIWVDELFVDLLHREADRAALDAYFPRLVGGLPRPAAALEVLGGVEYRALLVQGLYTSFLHRPATAEEVALGVALLAGGASDEEVAALILGSAEYLGARGGGSNAGFVSALYQDLLGRPPSAAEQAQSEAALAAGATGAQVALQLLHSSEFRTRLIRGWFQAYLDRAPTDAELAAYLARFAAGETDEQLQASILGSPEYFENLADYKASIDWGDGSTTEALVRHATNQGRGCVVTGRHVFPTAGNKPVTVEITDPDGGTENFRGLMHIQQAPPPPAGRENVQPFGTVLIKLNGRFVPLTNFRVVPLGTELDTTRGRVRLTSHDGSSGLFYEGRFKLLQVIETVNGRRKPVTLLLMTAPLTGCPTRTTSAVTQRPGKKVIRHVWGNAKGSFRTRGKYASATVRGTLWETLDYCDGTLVRVLRGRIDVFDVVRRAHHLITARHSFFVRAP